MDSLTILRDIPLGETNILLKDMKTPLRGIKTSLGFHTFTISKRISMSDYKRLYTLFDEYKKKTNEIILFRPNYNRKDVWQIAYKDDHRRGIAWYLRICPFQQKNKECLIEARINPKILSGINDYITASNSNYLNMVRERFDEESKKIFSRTYSSMNLRFDSYSPKRIDYCVNFDLKELGIDCTPEQMMKLIKMGDCPYPYREWQKYDPISKRKKSEKGSHYLKSGSVNINCYYKYMEMFKKNPDYPFITKALHIIRFEVQCKYRKLYGMKEFIKREYPTHDYYSGSEIILNELLSDTTSQRIIETYFARIIRPGDYYTLEDAIKIVKEQDYSCQHMEDIICILKDVNRQGFAKTKASLGSSNTRFTRALNSLAKLGINPVTIPKSFGVKRIPNLLDAYGRLKDSGHMANSLADPFEPLEMPFEDETNDKGFDKNDDVFEGSDPSQDQEPDYEENICF